ncbi:MAG: D-alanyl-D-alanine carboxypeptidase [Spirochaetes bacterium]|nr:D-alanyl-D-alanine carboxypeptidase [Spirochaetota bacterium]MBU1080536.1 D-alanyl-D-alanine carboxypeptidase [Spirochaetota bacterium]
MAGLTPIVPSRGSRARLAARITLAARSSLAAAMVAVALSVPCAPAFAAEAPSFRNGAPPAVDAKSVIIVDMANGDVLYERDADAPIPPASLAKIMTMMIALDAVDSGRISLSDRVSITRQDATLPYRSSLMYLAEGMSVPFDDLLRGMAVISGNDAALTVARVLAGSTSGFAELMNAEAKRLGLEATRFVEPSGLSEFNVTTAREMAILSRAYLLRHPNAISDYHSRTTMNFPRADVMPEGVDPPAVKILLQSTNKLLFSYDGCDGLKTGYIDESGYNLVATAERDGTRFIIVTLGGESGPGGRERSGKALLDWSFSAWKTVRPVAPEPAPVRAWGGAQETVELAYAERPIFTVPASLASGVTARIEAETEVEAPVEAGTRLGRIVFVSGGSVVRRIDLVAASDVRLGNVFVRVRDALVRFFRRIFVKA